MGVSANDDESMLNINSRKWMDDSPGICWDPERRPVFALSKTKIGILLETGDVFRILDLGLCPTDIISKELQGSKSSNNVSKMEEIKRKKLEISKEQDCLLQGQAQLDQRVVFCFCTLRLWS